MRLRDFQRLNRSLKIPSVLKTIICKPPIERRPTYAQKLSGLGAVTTRLFERSQNQSPFFICWMVSQSTVGDRMGFPDFRRQVVRLEGGTLTADERVFQRIF